MDTIRVLRGTPIFADLSRPELEMIAQITKQQKYSRYQVLMKAGEQGSAVFFLTSGAVRVSVAGRGGKESVLAVLYPGDVFGEMAILDSLPRSATVTALEESEVLAISRDEFLECIRKFPHVAAKLIITLSLRLRRMNQKVRDIAYAQAPQRVARTLLELAQGREDRVLEGHVVDVPYTHRELAEMAGVSRETFSRLLAKMHRLGLLTLKRRKLCIHDPVELETFA